MRVAAGEAGPPRVFLGVDRLRSSTRPDLPAAAECGTSLRSFGHKSRELVRDFGESFGGVVAGRAARRKSARDVSIRAIAAT